MVLVDNARYDCLFRRKLAAGHRESVFLGGDVSSFALGLYLAHCGSAGQSSDGVDHYAIEIDNDSLCLFQAALGVPFGEMIGFGKSAIGEA